MVKSKIGAATKAGQKSAEPHINIGRYIERKEAAQQYRKI